MGSNNTTQGIRIQIRFGERFRSQVVEKGCSNPLTGMTIEVGGHYVLGSSETAIGDYMTGNFLGLFEALPSVIRDEKQVVEFYNGPMWLVFEPVDGESMTISGCHTIGGVRNPSQRISEETSQVVDKQAWISELVRMTKEYVKKICDLNPSLVDQSDIQTLSKYVDQYEGWVPE